MKYKDVDNWEIDTETEEVILKIGDKEVDRLSINQLTEIWLEEQEKKEITL